jgi:hypothetical protein
LAAIGTQVEPASRPPPGHREHDRLRHYSIQMRPNVGGGTLTLTKSFSLSHIPEEKRQFLDLIRANRTNEDIGDDYIESDFMLPTNEEIRNARPLRTILPEDVLSRAVLIATNSASVLKMIALHRRCGLTSRTHKAAAIFPFNPFSRQCETIFIPAE